MITEYDEVAEIVKEVTGIVIQDTKPEVYVPAILKALKKLQREQCTCKEEVK